MLDRALWQGQDLQMVDQALWAVFNAIGYSKAISFLFCEKSFLISAIYNLFDNKFVARDTLKIAGEIL